MGIAADAVQEGFQHKSASSDSRKRRFSALNMVSSSVGTLSDNKFEVGSILELHLVSIFQFGMIRNFN